MEDFFGKNIKQERELANVTIAEMAKKTGLAEHVLVSIEEGKIFPNIKHLMKIAHVLNKHDGYFLTKFVYKK